MSAFEPRRLCDPLHNLIKFRGEQFEGILWDVIQTRPFQRLRRIKQLGFSDFVFPGATHSRFAHSIGVFHTARQLMQIIREKIPDSDYEPARANEALAAALVHDLGHGPFSHAFEDVGRRLDLKMAKHEHASDALIRNGDVAEALSKFGSGFPNDVADIIQSERPRHIYGAVVSSQFDADRLDYVRRDRLLTGTGIGAIDFEWHMANLEVGEVQSGVDEEALGFVKTFVLGPKAIHAAEAYVLGLFQLYPTVYLHKTTRGAEKVFTELLLQLFRLIQDSSIAETGLPDKHPFVQFANNPGDVEKVLDLDDTVVWGALPLLVDAKNKVVSTLALRLRDRKLYKCIDVRESIKHELELGATTDDELKRRQIAVDRACESVKEMVGNWLAEKEDRNLRVLSDEAVREPYKQIQESKGPLNQIMIKNSSGDLVDLGKRSKIVRAIDPFRCYRLYVDEGDDDARKFVMGVKKLGVDNGAKYFSKA